jgi:hypothetical protein
MTRRLAMCLLMLSTLSASAHASSVARAVFGSSPAGEPVSFAATILFTPGPGDFSAGSGTAVATITLENTSGVVPNGPPAIGNGVLTEFLFNLPPGILSVYAEARLLSGGALFSRGTTIAGEQVPAGCQVLTADRIVTSWYALDDHHASGQYGMFSNAFDTGSGVRAGLVDPDLIVGCVPQGQIFAPLVYAGRLRFTLMLYHLGTTLDSADDFLTQCSTASGTSQPSSLGAKFRATDLDGGGSAFVGDPCGPTATLRSTWGTIKSIYR